VLVSLVASRISSNLSWYRNLLAIQLIRRGNLFVVLDDLDRLPLDRYRATLGLADRWRRNSFVFLTTSRICSLGDVNLGRRISMPPWGRDEGRTYLKLRFDSARKADEVISELESHRLLGRLRTPLHWRTVADAYEEARIFQVFSREITSPDAHNYTLLEHYIWVVLGGGAVSQHEAARKLGKLALKLIKTNRNTFTLEETGLPADYVNQRLSRLFAPADDKYAFVHNNYQVLLAGRYVGKHWLEAEAELRDDAAKSLIWTEVYDCARAFIPEANAELLRKRFELLSVP
jgi:hypothetical protein